MNGEGLLSMGFQYLSCIRHAQLSKAANRLTGEKCLRRRRAKNHVVGFRECYWFSGGSR